MKNKRIDKTFALITIGMVFAFAGDIFFEYDSSIFFLSLIMLFVWDISMTLKRFCYKTLGDDDG